MKHLLALCLVLFIYHQGLTQTPPWLQSALDSQFAKIESEVNCDKQVKVLQKTFDKLVKGAFTKIAPNVAGEIKQGSGANIKFGDENTTAEIQSTFILSSRWLLNFGFNGSIQNNIADIFSGKDGLASDWGAKIGISYSFRRGLYYKSVNECREYHAQRTLYLLTLYDVLKNPKYLDTNRTSLRENIKDFSALHHFGSGATISSLSASANRYADLLDLYRMRKGLFKDENTRKDMVQSLYNFIEDSVVSYEMRTAQWQGYNIWLLNGGLFYNRKGFTQFIPSPVYYPDRFRDTAYGNYGASIGVSLFRSSIKTQQNANISVVFQNQSNFELPENKKYQKTYVTDSAITSGAPSVTQHSSDTKKAFDSTKLSFNTFSSVDLNMQYTIFFGDSKSFGINAAANYSNSRYYSVRDRLDIFLGPVVALSNSEKEGSKLNFGLMIGYKNILDKNTNVKDKFNVAFNVSIPLKLVSL